MTRINFLMLSIIVFAIGCSPEEGEVRNPDEWLSSSNIDEAETLYMRDNTLRMLTKTGVVETVEIKDSDGAVLSDVSLQGGCARGDEFFGQLYSYEAGGNYLVWVDPTSGKIKSMASNNLPSSPCRSSIGTYQVHRWDDRIYFEYSEQPYGSLSLVEAKISDKYISVKKVFDFPTTMDEVRVLDERWFYQTYSSSDNILGNIDRIRITDFKGEIHYDGVSTLAFIVDAYNPKILLEMEGVFELLEYSKLVWQARKITTTPQLEILSEYNLQPSTTILTFSNDRTLFGVEKNGSVDLFEWTGENIQLEKEVFLDNVYSYQAYGNEIVFLSKSKSSDQYLLTSYNIESKILSDLTVDIEYTNHWLKYQFTESSILFSQKLYEDDGITVKSYDLYQVKNLDLGLSNTTPIKIDSFTPNDNLNYVGGVYNNFFHIEGASAP
ncbi:hypothetical protein QWZ13_08625 [Reinekea marina]|uniref:Uncharacterized protein n=1 Tax=Reinekea marina TaxID=1310421 RepID=A0ABV7WSJ5_9GAMM|nr:hypothetical protein [Reinekea marina]MDN3648973.1 hypothetical protein [Reinekea marina]